MIGLMLFDVDVSFTCGECSFNSLGSWSYSKEWVSNLGHKVCCIATGKRNVNWVTLQEFNIMKYSYTITPLIACLWPNS